MLARSSRCSKITLSKVPSSTSCSDYRRRRSRSRTGAVNPGLWWRFSVFYDVPSPSVPRGDRLNVPFRRIGSSVLYPPSKAPAAGSPVALSCRPKSAKCFCCNVISVSGSSAKASNPAETRSMSGWKSSSWSSAWRTADACSSGSLCGRPIGWMFAIPFVLFLIGRGRGYYMAPGYPMLFAAGAVWGERWVASLSSRRVPL